MGEELVPGRFAGGATVPYDEDVLFAKINAILSEGAYATVADMDLYVDPAGNDVTGTGLVGAPYATVTRALQDVPETVNHYVHIHVAAGIYAETPSVTNKKCGSEGVISIDGSAAVIDTAAGPYTIDAGGWSVVSLYSTADITVVGGGLVPNALQNKFVQYLTGVATGLIVPIISNTATVIRVTTYGTEPAPGDTFKIVEPGVEFQIVDDLKFSKVGLSDSSSISNVWLCCLKITNGAKSFYLDATSLSAPGSIITTNNLFQYSGLLSGAGTNVLDISKIMDAPTLVSAYDGGCIIHADIAATNSGSIAITAVGDYVDLINTSMMYCAVYNVTGDHCIYGTGGYNYILNTYIESRATGYPLQIDTGTITLTSVFVEAGKVGLLAGPGTYVKMYDCAGAAANIVDAGVEVNQGATIYHNNTTLVSVGSVEIKWTSGAADAAWPASHAVVTDAVDAKVVGVPAP